MQNKRIWVRTLTRLLYAGGIVFLVSGVLLSAISIPVIASGSAAAATDTPCPCQTQTPVTGVTHTPGAGGSSLIFTSGCNCSCSNTQAVVCNVGSANMQQSVNWDLYFSADGNPVLGQKISTGKLGPLNVGQCTTLNYTPIKPGFYAYVVKQEPNHEGPGTVWSNSCEVSGACFPTPSATHTSPPPTATYTVPAPPTATYTVPAPPTATNTVPPPPPVSTFTPPSPATETPTHAPVPVNLSAVCGYAEENIMLWKVANHTGSEVNFTWRVSSGSSETGSGSVAANSDTYFTTSNAAKTVEIFVNNELADTENAVAPCKQYMVLSYQCTPEGIAWFVHNPNNFAVDIVWSIDGKEGGRGPLGANAQAQLVVSQPGAHTVQVQWTDTRPGTHTVALSSDANSCINVPPVTPTLTETPPQPTFTFTPTPTYTQPVITLTPTNTSVPPTRTFTPTPTNTVPVVAPTNTFTPTPTNTVPVIPPTNTFTPTPTNTIPAYPPPASTLTFTPTPTNTVPASTFTFTPTATNTVPASTFTFTPSPTVTSTSGSGSPPLNVPTFTQTPQPPTATTAPTFTATVVPSNTTVPTATVVNTVPPPVAVSTPIIIPVTGADALAPARTTGLIGKLFTNIGLVMLGMALALTGLTRKS